MSITRKKTVTSSSGLYAGLVFTIMLISLTAQVIFAGNRDSVQMTWSEKEIMNLTRNYEYRLLYGSSYRLKDGKYEVGTRLADYVSVRLADLAVGDLNADGRPEVAVILVSNFGGSGFFMN